MSRYLAGDVARKDAPACRGLGAHGRMPRLLAAPVVVCLASAMLAIAPAAPVQATCANPVVCENQLPGTPQSVWDVTSPSATIQGFADPFSVNVGGSINFKIESPATSYKVDVYRMGYYGGDGARLVTSLTPNISVSQTQPACNTNASTGLVDCGNWGVSATWNVPATAVSGVYFVRISRTDGTPGANQIPFVVTDNSSHSDIVFMTSDETWQAYNDWGGYNLYSGNATGSPWCCSAQNPGRAVQVSYNRPFATRSDTPNGQDFFFYAEFPTIQFLEKNGYDVSYVSQVDVAQSGAATMLEQHKMLMNVGHSEYWDAADRANVTAARDAGVNLAFFTGNTMWWKTRWVSSQYGSEPYRTLVSYKETLDSAQTDPADPPTWTGAWRDPRFSPPADGQPENTLTGQLWKVNCCSYADQVPSAYSKLRLWRNTAVASLPSGQIYAMPSETLGYEWDLDVDNGFRPAGEIDMSRTCEKVDQLLYTVTEEFVSDNACNSLTLYRAASGALVFDAGTVQWAWGLESDHDGDSQNPPDPAMQQATVNLFADMGAQPATLESDLTPATASADRTPPTSAITSPSAGATFTNGSTVTITGTATDSGGGVVAGVEVSADGGSTWHPVTAMSAAATTVNWSYTWSAAGSGPVTIESRATDDSGNTEAPGPGVSVTVNCPCGVFGANWTPYVASANDSSPYELGMKFQSSVSGWVAGVRFYKGTGNGGTHTGSLWTSSGTLLATGQFTNETAGGWQTMLFPNPVQISANTTYVVSYYDPLGHYSVDEDLFDSPVNTPPLTAVKANYVTAGGGNGVFNPGGPGFPTLMNHGWSFSVDVIFDTTQPPSHPAVTSVTPNAGSSSNPVSSDPTAAFSEAVVPSTVSFTLTDPNGNTVPGTTSFNGSDTVATFTPANPLAPGTTYTATISGAQDNSGQAMLSPDTYTFITSKAFDSGGKCPCAIWPDVAPSGTTDAIDGTPVQLGVKFTASQDGSVSGIRFYKVPDNTGTHTGSLWSSTGTLLATGTFTNESSEGWEELDFSTPVPVTAGTTYVASYHTNAAHYAYTSNGLASAVTSGPLTALASGSVYAYGSASTFPSNSANASNYWVDVVYTTPSGTFSPVVSSATPSSGSSGNPVSVALTATFSQAVVPSTVSFTLKDSGGNPAAGSVAFNGADTVATFTPTNPLAPDATYTATVSGAQNTFGTPMSNPYSWSFTTAGAQCPCSIWPNTAQPSVASANDPGPVNLGVKFTADVSGWVAGIRFYKGAGNTGTHVGSLWSSTGTLLGQVTFTNESASGWQEADFSSPIPVTAGTTYIASYFAPNGGYAYDPAAFANAGVDNPPLHALQSSVSGGNGVYGYGGSPGFPASSYNATNYWVDVVFTAS
jgi:methionine-rich copper-binding protein CopC